MKKYDITGMSCAACSAAVEKAVLGVEGVTSCSVNLLTNSMIVEGNARKEKIISAVNKAGYGARISGKKDREEIDTFNEMKILKNRLIFSLVFLIILMYFSMGHSMFGLPVPPFFEGNHIAIGIFQLLLSALIMLINNKFFINGFKGFIRKAPNMDTLVALGSGASFLYSVYILFMMTDSQLKGNSDLLMHYMHEFYFESAAMILTLITVGKTLESYSKGKTTSAIKSLLKLAPKTAVIIKDENEITVSVESVKIGDIFIVRPGEKVPVDGIVLEGNTVIDESMLTGESIPVDKVEEDSVSAGTINTTGYIKCKAVKVGEATTLAQIIKMVSDAAATKPPISKAADKVSGIFVPSVLLIALVTLVVWILTGATGGFALERAISVLVISCPCALGLATPVAVMVGNGVGAKNGILFKTAAASEIAGKTEIVVFDKTGTITKGEPEVTDLITCENVNEEELIKNALSLEIKSEHPLSRAIVKKAEELNIEPFEVDDFEAVSGKGLKASVNGEMLFGGNLKFIDVYAHIDDELKHSAEKFADEGKTPLYFARNGKLLGVIAVADVIKEDSKKAVSELKRMGIDIIMLTGDNERTAKAIAEQAGIEKVIAGVLPQEKEKTIRDLKKNGKVLMVGDGINDAPALASADVGVAIGAGTDVAIDAADVVLIKSRLTDIPASIRLGRAMLRNIHENLFWAFIYNAIGIPLAAGIWIGVFGWKLNPMFGAAAMSLSSFCVVMNSLRLNLIDIRNSKKDKRINSKKEKKSMTKTLRIEGMMCPHCEARVKKCLEALDGVESVIASHEKGTAEITLSKNVEDDILIKAVKEQGYDIVK